MDTASSEQLELNLLEYYVYSVNEWQSNESRDDSDVLLSRAAREALEQLLKKTSRRVCDEFKSRVKAIIEQYVEQK